MPIQTLLPKEKRRVERLQKNITFLSKSTQLSETYRFILKQQLRILLMILGAGAVDKKIKAEAIAILQDMWPFKIRRLRKLIKNGRRQSLY